MGKLSTSLILSRKICSYIHFPIFPIFPDCAAALLANPQQYFGREEQYHRLPNTHRYSLSVDVQTRAILQLLPSSPQSFFILASTTATTTTWFDEPNKCYYHCGGNPSSLKSEKIFTIIITTYLLLLLPLLLLLLLLGKFNIIWICMLSSPDVREISLISF